MSENLENEPFSSSFKQTSPFHQILSSNDPIDQPDFNAEKYINALFPSEQSLSSIDDVINKLENNIKQLDKEIRHNVRAQTSIVHEGKTALTKTEKAIKHLFHHVKNIKDKAEQSEEIVKEITQDIKLLDIAKTNLTCSITSLNHLHMLISGIETLKMLTEKKQYGAIILPLQATTQVMQHFKNYKDVPHINAFSEQMQEIHVELAKQITSDFKTAFTGQIPKYLTRLTEGCLVLSVLDSKVRKDLLTWFVGLQLQEYSQLFDENQDFAWIDKVDRRYAWFKKHLLNFESKFASIFPNEWEVPKQIALEFCNLTNQDLSKLMQKRKSDIDVKVLLYAITKTINFENLLNKRFADIECFTQNIMSEEANEESCVIGDGNMNSLVDIEQKDKVTTAACANASFRNLITSCFEPYLYIYLESIDQNLSELIETFVNDIKKKLQEDASSKDIEHRIAVLPSCADLFIFYKKCILQCSQLGSSTIILRLSEIFQKYLREYAVKILQNHLPKINSNVGIAASMTNITREFKEMSTSGFIQNFQIFLKEGDSNRYSKEEQTRICNILVTAEYCLETTQQLEEKLREKSDKMYSSKINLSQEQDSFHGIITSCIQLLVQDLELGCEPQLVAMTKMQWSSVEIVGDQSTYISLIITHLKQVIPVLRENLSSCRKYFTQLCVKFVSSFIPKLIHELYKCKPLNTMGAEQLLLDMHILKASLLDLPSFGCSVKKRAPVTYTKIVIKGMTTAEMILKVVITPSEPVSNFIAQCKNLLPDISLSEFQKILEMKGLRKNEQFQIQEEFKKFVSQQVSSEDQKATSPLLQDLETGRIKKLEKLIKKRI